MALTTVANLNTYLGQSDLSTAKTNAVNAACATVQNYTGYIWDSTVRYEWHKLVDATRIVTRQRPITYLYRVMSGLNTVAHVTCSTTGATDPALSAQFTVQGETSTDKLVSVHTRTPGDSSEYASFTVSADPTLDELATDLAALAFNGGTWTMTVVEESYTEALLPVASANCLDTEADVYGPDETIDTDGVDADAGVIRLAGPSTAWVYVMYAAGYSTAPYDLTQITTELAAAILQSAGVNSALQSERIGDYSYTLASASQGTTGIVLPFVSRLDPYKRRSL